MKIKDIIVRALNYTGREDVAALLSDGAELDGEASSAVTTLLYCVNAVEDELARYYFPIERTETVTSQSGIFAFKEFLYSPVRILNVKADGKEIDYKLTATAITADAKKISVTYEYVPSRRPLEGESAFADTVIGESLVAAGAASEYCLIRGAVKSAEMWESRYREEIEKARKKNVKTFRLPPRRWI